MLKKIEVQHEMLNGEGPAGSFYLGDVTQMLPHLLSQYAGKVHLVYMDPPFVTGQQFSMRMRVGEKDWKSGASSLALPAYDDSMNETEYLDMMREVLVGVHELLCDTGVIFLHIDFRMHAKLRLMMDEIFGEHNLLNEIVWSYQTGGRARRYFSRKHDIILFYKKGKRYFFNINAVAVKRVDARRNHMKKHVDTDGRVYRSIRSGNKIYTYYDDEPAYPGDVWDDVSHMQQKDPQRTGYDTQKPLKLLERIILCGSRPGDLVMDVFSGSGTTLEAAWQNGRKFVGVDQSASAFYATRRRLKGANMRYHAPACPGEPLVEASISSGIAYYDIALTLYQVEADVNSRKFAELDAVDGWAAGYMRGDAFVNMAQEMRTKQKPTLDAHLSLPVYEGTPVIRISDVLGRYFYYLIDLGSLVT